MHANTADANFDVAVVGGGIGGAALAWFAAHAGARVLWLTGTGGSSATSASGGMLAPKAEGLSGKMLDLGRRALAMHESFVAAVEAAAQMPIHRGRGLWLPAISGDPVDWLLDYAQRRRSSGDAVEIGDRSAWPTVLPDVPLSGTIAYPDEGWVDPRGLLASLHVALSARSNVVLQAAHVTHIDATQGRVHTASTHWHAGHILIAAGYMAANIGGLDWQKHGPIWGDRGLMLRLSGSGAPPGVLYRHDPRGITYVVPDPVGVRLGSTSTPRDPHPHARAAELAALLTRGCELWPPLRTAKLEEVAVGWRPCGPGNHELPFAAPLAGNRVWGLLGLERNGVLLAPYLAQQLVAAIAQDTAPASTRLSQRQQGSPSYHAP